jgi:hypothetical protein
MKTDLKIKLIYVSAGVLLIIGVAFIWYTNDKSKHGTSKPIANQMEQDLAMGSSKGLLGNSSFNNESTSNQLTNQKLVNQAQNEEQIKKVVADAKSIGGISQETTESKETPAEILQRYFKVTESQEVKDEVYAVVHPMEVEIQQTYLQKINDLEKKEKELENDLATASDENRSKFQGELEKLKVDLWEIRVEESEKVTLMADAGHKVLIRYLTNEDIRIAREEMWRTMAPPVGALQRDEFSEIWIKAGREAMKRLKAKGWVPANPNESYYVN